MQHVGGWSLEEHTHSHTQHQSLLTHKHTPLKSCRTSTTVCSGAEEAAAHQLQRISFRSKEHGGGGGGGGYIGLSGTGLDSLDGFSMQV